MADPEVSVANFPNFVDPEMQQWAAEASATDDFETRKALYGKIMTRINEQAILWYSGGTATADRRRAEHPGHQQLDPVRAVNSVSAPPVPSPAGKRCSSPPSDRARDRH